jgi:hypothetical protein
MKLNKKAWKILNQDEQLALSLKLGHGKSTWQAGEVMEKAHYKFLEIEGRAAHFLKMFTDHYNVYKKIIPEYIKMDRRVKRYFKLVMIQRLKVKDAIERIDDSDFSIRAVRENLIVKDLSRLVRSDNTIDNNIALLIFEFDRWNNFRVLPMSIQEPSAFKRRNKNNDKRNLKHLLSINSYSLEKIKERYHSKSNDLYMPMPSKYDGKMGYGIIKVKKKEKVIGELSRVGFFIFYKEKDAQFFYDLAIGYKMDDTKTCKEGQVFWPKYRKSITRAMNYNSIGKKIASRKFLQSALDELDSTN